MRKHLLKLLLTFFISLERLVFLLLNVDKVVVPFELHIDQAVALVDVTG